MSGISVQLEQARAELRQNARLRAGVWLILLIGLSYVLLVQSDRLALADLEFASQVEQLRKAQALQSSSGWTEQLVTQQSVSDALAGALWEAETQGLAQASLQAALNEMIAGLEIRNGRIRSGVMQPVADMPGVWQIQVQLDGSYRLGAELQLLYAIARYPNKLVIDRLDLSRQNSRLLVLVSAYFVGITADG